MNRTYDHTLVVDWMQQRFATEYAAPTTFQGILTNHAATDCDFAVNIDVIQTGVEEPIYLTEVDKEGRFELVIARKVLQMLRCMCTDFVMRAQ